MKEVIRLVFWDHVIGGKEPEMCCVVGEFMHEDDLSIVVRYWSCNDKDNDEYLTVLKSTVLARAVAKFE
jgi:hypothetical protein